VATSIDRIVDLSEHTLDINRQRYNVDQLDLIGLDDFIRELSGTRQYEYDSIRDILIYLWGGGYNSILDLAVENWNSKKVIRDRFYNNKQRFLNSLPLSNKISGVCNMATGTGKSYVIFAVAYLSIILGKVNRVLVLTPSSTIIKRGLYEKFYTLLYGEKGMELRKHLPSSLRDRYIKLITRNDPPIDNSIMIENINAIYQYFQDKEINSVADYFAGASEILVLSDEVHHAYSRLKYENKVIIEKGIDLHGRQTDAESERRWMTFIKEAEKEKINRHIGFTGTPYNSDDFFTDVIFNYSIRSAIDEKYIKDIDPILKYDQVINKRQRYEQIIQTHYQNKEKYSYNKNSKAQVKPISVFICKTQKSALKNSEEFILILAEYLKVNSIEYSKSSRSTMESIARQKVLCVISKTKQIVRERFENVEEVNPAKPGGNVEFVFSVQMLTEGWDVDNVFQIIPMEERAFNSKLLISQVLGRGLRLPRNIRSIDILQTYPILTVTNHDNFSKEIEELLNQVTQSELRFRSTVLSIPIQKRYTHHFIIYNIRYLPKNRVEEKTKKDYTNGTIPKLLNLEPQNEHLSISVEYKKGVRKFNLTKEFFTVDEVVSEIYQRFKTRTYEGEQFDFGQNTPQEYTLNWKEIKQKIKREMERANISGDKLTKENRLNIGLFFNQYLSEGKKKVIRENVEGELIKLNTTDIPDRSASVGNLDNFISIFLSENYKADLNKDTLSIIEEISDKNSTFDDKSHKQQSLFNKNLQFDKHLIRQLIPGKMIFIVNESMFRTPQDLVIVSYAPERQFVFKLIENSKFINSWIKSPDKGFYSLEYTFWKKGKDRTIRSFNPDFFININLNSYLENVEGNNSSLHQLKKGGVKELILAVEIKGNDEMNEKLARAKERAGFEHFNTLTTRLLKEIKEDDSVSLENSKKQFYSFYLLHPKNYEDWFLQLKTGTLFDIPNSEITLK
jgi:type III restriction enzyme